MILENGVVRTHGPGASRRSRARDRGRARRRRRRRPRDGPPDAPRWSISAAAASSPASRTRTSTSRPGRSHSVICGSTASARSQRRSSGFARTSAEGAWIRGHGLALGGLGSSADEGRARRGHGRRSGRALGEGLPLAVAELRGARARRRGSRRRRRSRRARRDRRADRRPARGGRVALPRALPVPSPRTSGSRSRVAGVQARAQPRRHGGPRQGRLARRARDLPARCATRRADAPGLAVAPVRAAPELEALGLRSGLGDDFLRLGYLKVFMDGTLGSQTAWMLDGSGVAITSGEELAEIVRAGARAGWPVGVHAIGDRANREALDAFEATTRRMGAARPAAADRARAVPRAGGSRPLRGARRHLLGAVLARALRPRSRRALLARPAGRRLRVPLAAATSGALLANGSDAPIEELDPLAGIRAAVTAHDRRPAGVAMDEALTVEEALARDDGRPRLARRRRANARKAPSRLSRRSRRSLPRPGRVPAGGARDRRGRRHDGRWPLGAQPPALGLSGRRIGREEGRRLFGLDPAAYDAARPGHADAVYEILVERCGLATGHAACSRSDRAPGRQRSELLALGADPLVALEPNPALAAYLVDSLGARVDVRVDRARGCGAADRATSISPLRRRRSTGSTRTLGLAKSFDALCDREAGSRSGGRSSARATSPDAFIASDEPVARRTCDASPTRGVEGRPAHALDAEARLARARGRRIRGCRARAVRWDARLGHGGHPRAVRDVLADRATRADAAEASPRRGRAHRRARLRRPRRAYAHDVALHRAQAG